jgi:hypothetical protein
MYLTFACKSSRSCAVILHYNAVQFLEENMDEIKITMFPDGRLDTKNASAYLGLSRKTLAIHRSNGTGPRFIKSGGKIFYYKDDLDKWLNGGGRVLSTAQAKVSQHKEKIS